MSYFYRPSKRHYGCGHIGIAPKIGHSEPNQKQYYQKYSPY